MIGPYEYHWSQRLTNTRICSRKWKFSRNSLLIWVIPSDRYYLILKRYAGVEINQNRFNLLTIDLFNQFQRNQHLHQHFFRKFCMAPDEDLIWLKSRVNWFNWKLAEVDLDCNSDRILVLFRPMDNRFSLQNSQKT